MFARKLVSIVALLIVVGGITGCEITASVYVQKDWNTDPGLYKANDMVTRAEIKATKLIGKDSKKVK